MKNIITCLSLCFVFTFTSIKVQAFNADDFRQLSQYIQNQGAQPEGTQAIVSTAAQSLLESMAEILEATGAGQRINPYSRTNLIMSIRNLGQALDTHFQNSNLTARVNWIFDAMIGEQAWAEMDETILGAQIQIYILGSMIKLFLPQNLSPHNLNTVRLALNGVIKRLEAFMQPLSLVEIIPLEEPDNNNENNENAQSIFTGLFINTFIFTI